MSEIIEHLKTKLVHRLEPICSELSSRVQARLRELSAKGVLQSGGALKVVSRECCQAYDEAVQAITGELDWALSQALYVRESFAADLIEIGVFQLTQIERATNTHISKMLSIARPSAPGEHAIRMQLHEKKEYSERTIRLFVRERRIEKPRKLLKNVWSTLFGLIKKQADPSA